MNNRPGFRIGLTGGIASGKSTVSSMLRQMGAVVIDTDQLAHEVTSPGSEALAAMSQRFGPEVLNSDGSLRRDVVGKIVFSNPEQKKWLESLLHPLIREKAEEQARAALAAGHGILVFDVPLLFESGWNEMVDEIWTVYVPPEIQQQRLILRDGYTIADAKARIASQWPIGDKAERSDVVIDNAGSLASTRLQVETAWAQVLRKIPAIGERRERC